MMEQITQQAATAVTELLEQANLCPGDLMVIGCSSSEMVGKRIGKGSSMEAAQAAFAGIYPILQKKGIHLAVQCCEHLNRTLIIERQVARSRGYEIVNVVPQPKAGGSFAVTACCGRSRSYEHHPHWGSHCTLCPYPSQVYRRFQSHLPGYVTSSIRKNATTAIGMWWRFIIRTFFP